MKIQVVLALPEAQWQVELEVPAGCTLAQAVVQSGLGQHLGEELPVTGRVGIWGKVRPLETPVKEGDRVEIYRPRLADPKEARRKRVK
jgi:putative ubiquitin-RnfH superfamily antitoxin RatB of RatAB toxin-antitoxin module